MASKNLFNTIRGALAPPVDATNEAGGRAYARTPKQALAQFAATGCLNGTFYASDEEQLATVLALCAEVETKFIAQVAVWSREAGFMKDMPALLCAILAARDVARLEAIFPRVIDTGKMLRTFVQIVRSGVTGRRSFGTAVKRLIVRWLDARPADALFRDSVGQAPSMADVIRMVHPKPRAKEREALYGYLLGRNVSGESLPPLVVSYEAFRRGQSGALPDVPFQMLTSLKLTTHQWSAIAERASWQTTRMNLNTFARHGVFANKEVTNKIAERIADSAAIRRARVFPYQLMVAHRFAGATIPAPVLESLEKAMEHATANVPRIDGQVFVCPDVSGSMSSPVTGHRKGATTAVRCIDIAALVTAAVVRKNPEARVLPFDTAVVDLAVDARDSILTNAGKLAAIGGGGTNCSAPLRKLNREKAKGDLVIMISDNESWADSQTGRGTATIREWNAFRARNPGARLVCIDIQPYATTQASESAAVLNIGGFSDSVFSVIGVFAEGNLTTEHWVGVIENEAVTWEAE
jgi:60 kDa SS-A/Ro ribonucleoprotein